ncbi:MAG: hypothetical protein ABMB14_41185, partial [Myxococcota bacterium]
LGLIVVLPAAVFLQTATTRLDASEISVQRSRAQLYAVLDAERGVVEQLGRLGADRDRLESAYLTLLAPGPEPERSHRADALVELLVAERTRSGAEVGAGGSVGGRVDRIVAARDQYETAARDWYQQGQTTAGSIAITLGIADAPTSP